MYWQAKQGPCCRKVAGAFLLEPALSPRVKKEWSDWLTSALKPASLLSAKAFLKGLWRTVWKPPLSFDAPHATKSIIPRCESAKYLDRPTIAPAACHFAPPKVARSERRRVTPLTTQILWPESTGLHFSNFEN